MKCQWLFGEPKLRNFCGKPVQPGSVYCEKHHKRCYVTYERNFKRDGKPGRIVNQTLTENTFNPRGD